MMKLSEIEIHNLAFLVSLGALGAGCDSGDDKSEPFGATAATTAPGGPSGDTGGDDGDDDGDDGDDGGDDRNDDSPGDGNADDGTTGGADGPADDGPADDGMMDDSTGASMDDGPPDGEVGALCEGYAEILGGCYMESADYIAELAAGCQMYLDALTMSDPACASAEEEWLACIGALSCRQFMSKETPCANVDFSACPDEGTSGGGGGG